MSTPAPSDPLNSFVSVASWPSYEASVDQIANIVTNYLMALQRLSPSFGSWNQYAGSRALYLNKPLDVAGAADHASLQAEVKNRLVAETAASPDPDGPPYFLNLHNDVPDEQHYVGMSIRIGEPPDSGLLNSASMRFGYDQDQIRQFCTPDLVMGVITANADQLGATKSAFLSHSLRTAQVWKPKQQQIGWATFILDEAIADFSLMPYPQITRQSDSILPWLAGKTGYVYALGDDPLNPPLDAVNAIRAALGYPG